MNILNTVKTILRNSLYLIIAVTLVSSSLALTTTSQANANTATPVECDIDFYSTNDVLYYNPCADMCSAAPGGGSTGVKIETLRGANNAEKIYNFWIDAGLTAAQSAGVTGSMKHEGGFSPFRQEMSQSWPGGGWGIAQFTHDPGQRGAIKEYLIKELGAELFNQYYKNEFGGSVQESNGYIPQGVPTEVNEVFLKGQLNYLLDHVKGLEPNNVRRDLYSEHFSKPIDAGVNLFDHLKTLEKPSESAIAWTYLYEFPGDIKQTSLERAKSAEEIATLFNGGSSAQSCGGLTSGGMNLEQAKEFMATYKQIDSGDPNGDAKYLTTACTTLTDNCVTFSAYFVNKFTNLNFGIHNGAKVVSETLAKNTQLKSGTVPEPYALFGVKKGVTLCDWDGNGTDDAPCGHTGIILGVDTAKGVVIVGEAAYCDDNFTAAREYPIDEWSNGEYSYAYLNSYIKPEMMGGLK